MPKTKFQNVVFTLMMSFLMVYAMICYNISMNIGGMTNQVFLMAFHEMMIMWPAAFILEFFLVDHLAHKLVFAWYTAGSSDRNHAGNFHYDYCYYVSDYEFYCNTAV